MSFISKVKNRLKNTSLGKSYADSQVEKKWKQEIRDRAKIEARKEAEIALYDKYKKEEVDNMVEGKKKSSGLQKLSDAFGGSSGASSKVERMLGTESKKDVGTRNSGQNQPKKSMTDKILGKEDSGSTMFDSDRIGKMIGSDDQETEKIAKTAKKHVPDKEFSFNDKLKKML